MVKTNKQKRHLSFGETMASEQTSAQACPSAPSSEVIIQAGIWMFTHLEHPRKPPQTCRLTPLPLTFSA